MSADASDSRYLRLDMTDGHWWDAEITGRDETGFHMSYANQTPLEAMQTDPALASVFAAYDMRFDAFDLADAVPSDPSLRPEGYAWCAVSSLPQCRPFACDVNYDTVNNSNYYTCGSSVSTSTQCQTFCQNAGYPTVYYYGTGSSQSPCPGNTLCQCGIHHFKTTNHHSCPRVNCTDTTKCDQADRVRACDDPGPTCSTAGTGYAGCTSQPPGTGYTCAYAGSSYTLSVTKSGSGTVSSSPSGISCGTTCSSAYLSGDVVTLTASPAVGYSFTGWGGACSGTGTCTVTMSANQSVSATFTVVTRCGDGSCNGEEDCVSCPRDCSFC